MIAITRSMAVLLACAIALAAAGGARAQTVFVSNEKDNTLSVIDGARLEVTQTIPVGKRPRGIVLSRDFTKLYVCASDDNRIEVIDTVTLRRVGDLPSGRSYEATGARSRRVRMPKRIYGDRDVDLDAD